MWRTIEKIRHQPEATRERLALGVAVLITILIFGVWLSIWYGRLNTDQSKEQQMVAVEKSDSPLSTIRNTFNQVFAEIFNQVGILRESVITNLATIEEYQQATSSTLGVKTLTSTDQLVATTTTGPTATTSSN